jgi:hypothetical protein
MQLGMVWGVYHAIAVGLIPTQGTEDPFPYRIHRKEQERFHLLIGFQQVG